MTCPFLLSDSQWSNISPYFEDGRRRKHSLRTVVSGIIYLLQTGCQWRLLPGCYGNWQLVYYYFRRWGSYAHFHGLLYELLREVRKAAGRRAEPSAIVVDTQSIKSAAGVSQDTGYDGGKKVRGRKTSLATDTMGNPVAVGVSAASCHDKKCILSLEEQLEDLCCVRKAYVDGSFKGEPALRLSRQMEWEVVEKKGGPFRVLPKRWVVERMFSWFMNFRRLNRSHEKCTEVAQIMLLIASVCILLNKLSN
jgi:putative transposase